MAARRNEVIFDRQWEIYRKIIDGDLMDHRDIHGAVAQFLETRGMAPGRVLDLGCGDAEISSRLVDEFGCRSFLGVDSSGRVLEEAAGRPVWEGREVRWEEADLLEFAVRSEEEFDLVLAGFSVHHLPSGEKEAFLRAIRERLSPTGVFVFYDVFIHPGLDREASSSRYLEWMRNDWPGITAGEYELIEEHIHAVDMPETVEWFREAAGAAGFGSVEELRTFDHGFHRVYALEG